MRIPATISFIQRWVVTVSDSEATSAEAVQPIKRQRVLQTLSTTSTRLNPHEKPYGYFADASVGQKQVSNKGSMKSGVLGFPY